MSSLFSNIFDLDFRLQIQRISIQSKFSCISGEKYFLFSNPFMSKLMIESNETSKQNMGFIEKFFDSRHYID